jgi:hypothetical protein
LRCGSGFLARAARDFSRNWTFLSLHTQNFARPYNTVARGSSPARNFRRLSAFRQITATFGKTFAKVWPLPTHDTPTETCSALPRGVSAARAEASRGAASTYGCPRRSRPTTWRPSGRRRPASTSSPRAETTTFALGGKGPRLGNGFHRRLFQLVLVARAVRGPHSDDLARTEALVPPRHMIADVVRL